MEKNLNVVFQRPNEAALEETEIPEPKSNEVLIKTLVTAISTGTELSMLMDVDKPEGSYWSRVSKFPLRGAGYNNVGRIIKVGKDVADDLKGKRAATTCSHASYVTIPSENARIIPDDIEDRHAVFSTFAVIVLNGVRRSNLMFGESAAVYGAGLLGQLTARMCRVCGAYPVIIVDTSDDRLSMVPDDKGYIKANPEKDDIKSVVDTATKGRKCDVVFEVTGNASIIPAELEALRKQGRFVILSSPLGKTLFDFHDLCNSPSYTIIGAHNGSHPKYATIDNPWTKERDEELFFDYLSNGFLTVEELITHEEPCTRAPELYKMLVEDRSKAMGVLLSW